MEIKRARADAAVAAVAGGTTIVLALLSAFVAGFTVGTLPTLVPLGVYAAYVFTRKGGPYGSVDTPHNWAALALLSGGVVVATSVVL